jgi:hypothetical protein
MQLVGFHMHACTQRGRGDNPSPSPPSPLLTQRGVATRRSITEVLQRGSGAASLIPAQALRYSSSHPSRICAASLAPSAARPAPGMRRCVRCPGAAGSPRARCPSVSYRIPLRWRSFAFHSMASLRRWRRRLSRRWRSVMAPACLASPRSAAVRRMQPIANLWVGHDGLPWRGGNVSVRTRAHCFPQESGL